MESSRRSFLRVLASVAGAAGASTAVSAQHEGHTAPPAPQAPVTTSRTVRTSRETPGAGPQILPAVAEIVTPDVSKMPWHLENGVKVFNISVEHVRTEFVPGRIVDAWGFNGSVPGPTIEVIEGDRLRFIVDNKLPESFSMHWHGLEVPNEMDGMPGISQELIPPSGRFVYEYTVHQNGTFFYHSHMAMQEMMGLIGLFVIHPQRPHTPRVDRDFGIILQEWAILPNTTIPNSLAMEFNWLTLNGKAGPAATPMLVRRDERVRIRIVNLGMDHHPMHIHGHQFYVTGTEGGRIQTTAVQPENTVLVGVAQARDIEFVANNPGDWHFHCHLPHHMMNQMASMVGPLMMSHANMMRPGSMTVGLGIVLPDGCGAVHVSPQSIAQERLAGDVSLTLAELEQLALQNNPTMRAAQSAIDAARGRARQAGAWPNPIVGYAAEEIFSPRFLTSEPSLHRVRRYN